jgi:hypothetical protein
MVVNREISRKPSLPLRLHSRPFSGNIFVDGVQIRLYTSFVYVCIFCLEKKTIFMPPV